MPKASRVADADTSGLHASAIKDDSSSQLIVIRSAATRAIVFRVASSSSSSQTQSIALQCRRNVELVQHPGIVRIGEAELPRSSSDDVTPSLAKKFGHGPPGKLVEEVLEVVRDLSGCQAAVLMDGPDASTALVYTRSDRIPAGTYFLHLPGVKPLRSQPPRSWHMRLASVLVALVTLGLVMQSLIFMAAVPFCGYNWKCMHNWYRLFISHIDGPFKVFTFLAAIQRAAAHPEIWLSRLSWAFSAIAGRLKQEGQTEDKRRTKTD